MPDAEIRIAVERLLGVDYSGAFRWHSLGRGVGGSLWCVQSSHGSWCVKSGAEDPQMLIAEADGLGGLMKSGGVRVPQVLAVEAQGGQAYLLMEWLDFAAKTEHAAAKLGERLAQQHRCFGKRFGWPRNNFIGATPQFNTPRADWVAFVREHRLGFQLRLAAENGYRGELQEQGERLLEKLPTFFPGYTPQPSLLHGDLWSGNWGALQTGEPVIFDPAVYYGDREADLAMTELFGGFPAAFYSAYHAAWPLDSGYRVRRDLYHLYHLLNHLNLFGGTYLPRVERVVGDLLATAG